MTQMITEPGIIGKIGLNSSGLGVCLNILRINKRLDGVPVHIVLRAVLDATNINDALDRAKASGQGKASNSPSTGDTYLTMTWKKWARSARSLWTCQINRSI